MSRRRVALVIGLLGFATPASATTEEGAAAAAARKQATEMYQAFVRGDHATFVGYMHPKITEMMGGREKTLDTIKKSLAAAKAEGLTPASATAAPVQQFVEVAPSKLQVIIPADVIMKGKDLEVHQRSFLLGFSSDGGKTWKFVDTGSSGADALRKIFPECSPALKIPPRSKPEVVRR